MTRARLITGALLCAAFATACGTDGGSPETASSASGATGTGTAGSSTASTAGSPAAAGSGTAAAALLPPIRAYVDAVRDRNLEALAASFNEDAELVDVGRRFQGRRAIRGWADREVIGGTLEVLEVTPMAGGQDLLVRFAPGGTGGFRAHYRFTVSGDGIATANLQYA